MAIPDEGGNPGNAPGRPRDPAVDRAILDAALDLFLEFGIAGASIEKIAKRAGVAKTSIYRRWPNREELLAQAIEAARDATGYTIDLLDRTAPQDFLRLLLDACEVVVRPELRKMMVRLIGSQPDCPTLLDIYRDIYFPPRRRALIRAFARVQAAGLLTTDADLETLADMLIGAFIYRVLMLASVENPAAELRDHLLRLLRLAGFDLAAVSG
jgi:AcrR family transcriptional regulator